RGAGIVSMSCVLETITARALGMRVLALAIVANGPARLRQGTGADGGEVVTVVESAVSGRLDFLRNLLGRLARLCQLRGRRRAYDRGREDDTRERIRPVVEDAGGAGRWIAAVLAGFLPRALWPRLQGAFLPIHATSVLSAAIQIVSGFALGVPSFLIY